MSCDVSTMNFATYNADEPYDSTDLNASGNFINDDTYNDFLGLGKKAKEKRKQKAIAEMVKSGLTQAEAEEALKGKKIPTKLGDKLKGILGKGGAASELINKAINDAKAAAGSGGGAPIDANTGSGGGDNPPAPDDSEFLIFGVNGYVVIGLGVAAAVGAYFMFKS